MQPCRATRSRLARRENSRDNKRLSMASGRPAGRHDDVSVRPQLFLYDKLMNICGYLSANNDELLSLSMIYRQLPNGAFTLAQTQSVCQLTLSPPMRLRHYTLSYWSNPLFLIFDIWALWRSVLSTPESPNVKN